MPSASIACDESLSKQSLIPPAGPEPDSTISKSGDCCQASDSRLENEVNGFAISTKQNDSSVLSENRRRIWVHGPRPEYTKDRQRYNLPSRITGLIRPNLDIVILPGNHAPTAEFWEFNRKVLKLEEWQVVHFEPCCSLYTFFLIFLGHGFCVIFFRPYFLRFISFHLLGSDFRLYLHLDVFSTWTVSVRDVGQITSDFNPCCLLAHSPRFNANISLQSSSTTARSLEGIHFTLIWCCLRRRHRR
jgi:hypothetical protein